MIDLIALKALMKERHLTHEALATLAGVSRTSVTKLLSGSNLPQYKTVYNIAKALKLTDSELRTIFFSDE